MSIMCEFGGDHLAADCHCQDSRIAALEAENKRLREALEKIKAKADEVTNQCLRHANKPEACAVLLSIAIGLIEAEARRSLEAPHA